MAAVNLIVVTRILRKYRRALFVKTWLALPIGHSNSALTGACLCSGQERELLFGSLGQYKNEDFALTSLPDTGYAVSAYYGVIICEEHC